MNTSCIQNQMSQRVDECVQNCLDCYRSCLAMVPHCLHRGGVHASQDHITMLLECAELCQVSARLMLLQSNIHFDVCRVCAKACENCADNCRSMATGDAIVNGTGTFGGKMRYVYLSLKKNGDAWKILGLEVNDNAPTATPAGG